MPDENSDNGTGTGTGGSGSDPTTDSSIIKTPQVVFMAAAAGGLIGGLVGALIGSGMG